MALAVLGKEIDCPNEWRALCVWFHVCFVDEDDFLRFNMMEKER